ncbi:MAG TPA: GAF domain-containing protein, partial [Pilimelia sp.]|nr:GAF domain-containing protein [Pilimelia sp.]
MSDPRVATAVAQQPDVLGRGAPASAAGGWARLAGRAVGAPVAAVWFVDGTALSVCDRWVAPGAEPGRSVAPLLEAARPFAELVCERGEPYEVRDHHADAGCRPAAKAFLGVAVPAPDGHPAGVLGVLDTEARAWLPADYTTLHDLAALIAAAAHRRAEPPAGRPALLLPALLDSLESVAVVTCDADGRIDLSHDQLRAPPDLP